MGLFKRNDAGGGGDAGGNLRIYYASDIHGTEVLWRKFLHAPSVYDAPVIVMGGDVTGKVVIPLVDEGEGVVTAELFGQPERAGTPEELADLEHRIRSNGMYPHLMTGGGGRARRRAERGRARDLVRRSHAAHVRALDGARRRAARRR